MYALGLDFGSSAVRALIVDLVKKTETASASTDYPCGIRGVCQKDDEPLLARQEPDAYLAAAESSICSAIRQAGMTDSSFSSELIAGIGVDATSSTIIPVTEKLVPLSRLPEFAGNLNAFSWMWKDHTSLAEAEEITALARKLHPEYLDRCGGSYSSEWFWSKTLHALRCDKKLFDAAYTWLELCDFIPAVLGGIDDAGKIRCSAGAAGHKAMFASEWGGLPDEDFLSQLDPELAALRSRMYNKVYSSDSTAGYLSEEWEHKTGIPAGTPIAAGLIDAHSGAAGSGAAPGKMVCIIGTSTCDITVAGFGDRVPEIRGISGIAKDSVIPGLYGIEGGHAAVGDSFYWQAATIGGTSDLSQLEKEASKLHPRKDGIIAIDWLNGNRNPYADEKLKGIMVGMTLNTTLPEMYRAWLEATAFGVRRVIDIMENSGFRINEIICAGGIPAKSPLLMQIYADVLGRKLLLPASTETCALGAALSGAAAARAVPSVKDAQLMLCKFKDKTYIPEPDNQEIYNVLYRKYCKISDAFATGELADTLN